MKPDDIHLFDWPRMLLGEVPGSFVLEAALRTVFVFVLLLVSMRLMGKRMASQLSRNEMAALVSLAAAIGVPVVAPDRGLIPAVIIALIVIVIERGISSIAAKNETFERIAQDSYNILVQDSVLQISAMRYTRITHARLFSILRSEGFAHLGTLKRVYIEANGAFTIIEKEQPTPGLVILPEWDKEFIASQTKVIDQYLCKYCGNPKSLPADIEEKCPNCGEKTWIQAVE